MAWLQSSFTNHQLGDSGNSHRKGYKVGAVNKNTDPDKSDTPLLHDSSVSPDNENATSDCFSKPSSFGKKQNLSQTIASKHGFLSGGIFDRSGGSIKLKNQSNAQESFQNSGKRPESKQLLRGEEKKKIPVYVDDDDDEDSEDEWCLPHSGGYQRVRPGAD